MPLTNIYLNLYQTHMSKIKIDCVIAIDPGKAGGIAVWRPNHATVQIKMPKDLMDLVPFVKSKMAVCNPIVVIEKLNMRPDDTQGGKAFGIVKMLQDFTTLKNIMAMLEVPFVLVSPMKWQNTLNVRVKGEEKKDRKKRYQKFAQQKFPELAVTLWSADALCICLFTRYVLKNDHHWIITNLPAPMHGKLFE